MWRPLLEAKASPDECAHLVHQRSTPVIYVAATSGYTEIVRLLLSFGANVTSNRLALIYSCERCEGLREVKESVEAILAADQHSLPLGELPDRASVPTERERQVAVTADRIEMEIREEHRARHARVWQAAVHDVQPRLDDGRRPLLNVNVAADQPIPMSEGGKCDAALIAACRGRHHRCVQLLLRSGANPVVSLPDGQTAMKCAKDNKDKTCVVLLIEALKQGQALAGKRVQLSSTHIRVPYTLFHRKGLVTKFETTSGLCLVTLDRPAARQSARDANPILLPSALRVIDGEEEAQCGSRGSRGSRGSSSSSRPPPECSSTAAAAAAAAPAAA